MAAGKEGVQIPVPLELRDEFLWQALKIKVLHPEEFLPVTDVKVPLSTQILPFPSILSSSRLAQVTMERVHTAK
jgi:hypothetical protein